MTLAEQKTTVDAFEIFIAQHPKNLFELIHGKIIEKVPTEQHGIIAVNISAEIKIYLKTHPIGQVGVEVRHRKPDDKFNDRMPDISFRKIQSDEIVTHGAVPSMPDLAIEIKSPTDTYKLMREKADYYLDNGTSLVWLIYPEKKFVEVYRKDADIDFLTGGDTLLGYDVLPEFELTVSEIFP